MDVLIQNIYSGICGTDAAVYKHGPNTGHRIAVGGEFGHETVSRVAAVGKNITQFRVGDRVYPYPLYAKNDTKRAGTIGGFSEYILVPQAKRNHSLYGVPGGKAKPACRTGKGNRVWVWNHRAGSCSGPKILWNG